MLNIASEHEAVSCGNISKVAGESDRRGRRDTRNR